MRFSQISCRDTHARQIWQAARDPAFSNPDPADHPFPNPDQAGNSPLSLQFPYFVLAGRIYWSGFHWAGRGRGWPVCWIFDSVLIKSEREGYFCPNFFFFFFFLTFFTLN